MGNAEERFEVNVEDIHAWRKQIDAHIKAAEYMLSFKPEKGAREIALVRTKLQEAKMWAGKVLEEIGDPLPAEFADTSESQFGGRPFGLSKK